jgi:phage virion morphogenesis protein
MANLTVRITNAEIRQAIARTIEPADDFTPACRRAGEYMRLATRGRFDTETAPDGTPWRPLNPRYAAQKARGRRNLTGILKRSGLLRDGITYVASKTELVIGSNRPYAAIHQFGGTIQRQASQRTLNFKVGRSGRSRFARRGRANFQQVARAGAYSITIPKREFLGVSRDDEAEIIQIVIDHFQQR